jgi:hypothetical protein
VHATGIDPVECADLAYSGPFSSAESIKLCSRNGNVATAQCAIRAYAGPYSKEQAITMCSNNPDLINRVLSRLHNENAIGFEKILLKSRLKALQLNELKIESEILK